MTVSEYEPKQCEKCEGYGAIEGKYCDCSSGQMAVRDALNRGDHVAVAFNHETGKKDVFVDRKHKPKIERAEPSRGAPDAALQALRVWEVDTDVWPTAREGNAFIDGFQAGRAGHVVLLEALRLAHRYFLQSNDLTVDDREILDEMWAAIKQAEGTKC